MNYVFEGKSKQTFEMLISSVIDKFNFKLLEVREVFLYKDYFNVRLGDCNFRQALNYLKLF